METTLLLDTSSKIFFSKEEMYAYKIKDSICQNILLESESFSFPLDGLVETANNSSLVFQELYFNPISRIKRGRIFEYKINNDEIWYRESVDILSKSNSKGPGFISNCKVFQIFNLSASALNLKKTYLYFGTKKYKSKWRVLAVDYNVSGEELFVLQEINGIGVIPNLNQSKIDPRFHKELFYQYNKLLAELNNAPETVIDNCRSTAVSLLSAKLLITNPKEREDLGLIAKKLVDSKSLDKQYYIAMNCAEIINRLHPRGKPNEVAKYNLRQPLFEDADFAVNSLFQIIREFDFD